MCGTRVRSKYNYPFFSERSLGINDMSIKPSEKIDRFIADLSDPLHEASWRGKMLAKIRKIIHETDIFPPRG